MVGSIKVHIIGEDGTTTRRLRLLENETLETIRSVLNLQDAELTYTDDESDVIQLSGENDWNAAIACKLDSLVICAKKKVKKQHFNADCSMGRRSKSARPSKYMINDAWFLSVCFLLLLPVVFALLLPNKASKTEVHSRNIQYHEQINIKGTYFTIEAPNNQTTGFVLGGDLVVFRDSNNMFLCDDFGKLVHNRVNVGEWEQFRIHKSVRPQEAFHNNLLSSQDDLYIKGVFNTYDI
ncbi:1 TM domain-containing transmembrane protein [Acrasis kona]|uniref:1 TM domain-containing transmembrane protein n=1 Tax=Acrasis kona TaxID=1008807 RepID=A0AAW2Z9N9_9EUKA